MSSRTAAYTAQRTADTWREQVAGALAAEGHPARPHVRPRKLGEQVIDTSGDVVGIDGVLITTHAARTLRLSESLDTADSLASCLVHQVDSCACPQLCSTRVVGAYCRAPHQGSRRGDVPRAQVQ